MRVVLIVGGLLAVLFAGVWFGFEPLIRHHTANSVDPPTGRLVLPGLTAPASIRRDVYGVPLVEAQNLDDLAFATGYAMAQDRLAQMVAMSLTAQGRLSEMAGETTFPVDAYMRTLGVRQIAEAHYAQVPPDLHRRLEKFSAGVNAWVDTHADRLPLSLRLANYRPDPWTPMDSMGIYVLLNLGLAMNMHQEVAFLNLAGRVGGERAAWLLPTMPDEPLPFAEAAKLKGIDLTAVAQPAADLVAAQEGLRRALQPLGMAASNNWVIAPAATAGGASILANDTHLLLQHPPMWMAMQLRAPDYQAAGISIAGIPGIVAGYNGHVAWGMTMVMADGQDLFVEELRRQGKRELYRVGNAWHPVRVREEEIRIRGRAEPVRLLVRSTRHGPLLDPVLAAPQRIPLQPVPSTPRAARYGLALAWTVAEPDASLAALWELGRAQNLAAAQVAVRDIRYIHLNLVYADRDNIGWQVTGRYPKRKAGSGKFPSPGWYGEYDWQGYWDVSWHPAQVNPPAGFFGTANDRKVPAGYPVVLSGSWFYPERGERIDQLLAARRDHTADSSVAMQADQYNLLAAKVRRTLLTAPLSDALRSAIGALPGDDALLAMEAHAAVTGWDGNQGAGVKDAAIFALFEDALAREAFGDELGADEDDGHGSPAWRSLLADSQLSYSATQDHLLQREDSPFWDDVRTPEVRETKADILARALARAVRTAEARLGGDRSRWQWGSLHTYTWRSPASEMRDQLPAVDRFFVDRLAPYLDRGPYPAGGSHNTLNVAGYAVGSADFDVDVVPAMRMVVDFSAPEPLHLVIAGGQSDDPASPHYDDGIALYLSLHNRVLPFNDEAVRLAHFGDELRLEPAPP